MATIRKQKVGKYTYWQIVESKRIDGKPRPVMLMHLGTAEQLLYKLRGGALKKKIRSASHGAVSLFWQAAKKLNLPGIFNAHFAQQLTDGLPPGTSLLLAAIHRAIEPGSKSAFAAWAKKTTLPEITGFNPDRLTSQHFWEQMDTVTEAQLESVEKAITQEMLEQGLLSSKLLFYDLTNFFTHIDSSNERAKLPQRGRNKQKRNDLRQFGLAQVVTKEFLIPVLSEVYEGNKTDEKMFVPTLTRLRNKLSELNLDIQELTVVFDKGSNSKGNFAELDISEMPYVASLTPSYHEDLLNVPLASYRRVQVNDQEILCYRTQKEVWGKTRTVIVFLSEKLRQGQLHGLLQTLPGKYEQLKELKTKLTAKRVRKRKREDVECQIKDILKGERCHLLIKAALYETEEGRFDLYWEIDQNAYRWTTENLFGKRILVTCRDNWSDAEIIAAYHGQSNVERVFKHLKNPYHNCVHPQYHWTDQKIKVHTFICLAGLLLSQVLLKKASDAGYTMSVESLIDRLSEVRMAEILTVHSLNSKPVRETQLEEMDPGLQKLYADLEKSVV
jgi:transposase